MANSTAKHVRDIIPIKENSVNNKSEEEEDNVQQQQQPPTIQTTIQEQHNQQQLLLDEATTLNVESKQHSKPVVKKPPDILCNCPQRCDQRVPQDIRSSLYKEFCRLGDHVRQNAYLQSYIEMRSIYKRLWSQEERIGGRLQRRVSCKYKVPIEIPEQSMEEAAIEELSSLPKITTNSKGQATLVVGSREGGHTIEVCQKAFMNVYGITEKRIRLQREKLIARLRGDTVEQRHYRASANSLRSSSYDSTNYPSYYNNSIIHHSNPLGQTTGISDNVEGHNDDELSIVDTFFRNQLWKPEYIGISSDKLQFLDVYYNNVKA